MTHLITTAIPTDTAAIAYLKANQQKYPNLDITPFIAKELYDTYITDKRNFVCPTDNCLAPVTCRSIDPSSKNRPTFVNQSLSINKHLLTCPYHPNNYDPIVSFKDSSSESFKHLKSGETVSTLSPIHGFQPLENSTATLKATTGVLSQNVSIKKNKVYSSNTLKKDKLVRSHLKSLEEHVEMYNHNPDFVIFSKSSKHTIPIKYMFKFLKKNVLFQNLHTIKYSYIYYSHAFLSETNKPSVLRLSFKCPLLIDGLTVYPSLIISKSHIENEYPDIYDQFITGVKTEFKVYTTLPFIKETDSSNKIYINFSSFKKSANVNPFSEELFYNLYIN